MLLNLTPKQKAQYKKGRAAAVAQIKNGQKSPDDKISGSEHYEAGYVSAMWSSR